MRPYIIIPALDSDLGHETLESVKKTAGVECGSIVAVDKVQQGFTRNANHALNTLFALSDYSHAVFLNEDVKINQRNWLARLLEAIDGKDSYGMASPTGACRTQPICNGSPFEPEGVRVVRQLPMFCTVIKKEVLDKLKYFDPSFIHYGSDSDYCERALRAGFELIWVQDVYVHNQLTPIREDWKEHDQEVFRRKWNW